MTSSPLRALGVIPARGGSKRVPRKNLRAVAGVPLVLRAMRSAGASTRLTQWVVSSEDEEVLELVRAQDAQAALQRPAALAGDETPGWAVLQHALASVEALGGGPFDVVVMLPPTAPFRTGHDIDETISAMAEHGVPSAASVVRVPHDIHPLKMKHIIDHRLTPVVEAERGRTMAHQLEPVFVRNGAVYVSRREVIARGLTLADECAAYVMPRERSVDINEPFDLMLAEFMARSGPGAAAELVS